MQKSKYSYLELKYMNQRKKESILTSFHGVKIPITNKESLFIYFRKFPKSCSMDNKQKDKVIQKVKSNTFNTNNSQHLEQSQHKTYKNKSLERHQSKKDLEKETSKKIINNFPSERSLIVVSLDKHFDSDELKQIFTNFGKVRRVFFMKLQKQKNNQDIFFYIVVFKNEKSLLECFDVEKFQWDLMKKYLPRFQKMNETEKELLFQDYIKSLKQYEKFDEDVMQQQIENDGYITQKPYKFDYPEIFKDLKRKKRKDKLDIDYYQFGQKVIQDSQEQNQNKSESIESLNKNRMDNPQYLEKRKKQLQIDFNNLKKHKKNQLYFKVQK